MTYVLIWNNNLVGGATYVGHASMQIGEKWNNTWGYVSWWPGGAGAGFFDKTASSRNMNFVEDLQSEGYAPDHVIHVPGLNTGAMQAEWNMIKGRQNSHYQMIRKNCSTIVARILKKGSKAGSFDKRHNAIWTPLKVKRLALEMGGEPVHYVTMLRAAANAGLVNHNEGLILTRLLKRDERHGNPEHPGFYEKGRLTENKESLVSSGHGRRGGFAINVAAGRNMFFVDAGHLYGGVTNVTPEGVFYDETPEMDAHLASFGRR